MARSGLTVDRLMVAAADLADEIGFENVTVSAVARRFGVKDASLYSHIKNVRDLRVRVAVLGLAELADRVGAAVAGRAGKDALVAFASAYRDYAKAHPGRYAATSQVELDLETATASAAGRHSEMTRAILRGYDLPERDQVDAVRLLHSVFHGFVSLEKAGGFRHSPGIDTSWSRSLDALDVALRNWPPA